MATAPQSFGRDQRLRKRRDFQRIQADSVRVVAPHFVFLLAAQPVGGARPRIGLIVTRKLGGAVVRNRIKRLCRECFRRSPELLPGGIDVVVIARSGAGELGRAGVQAEWARVHPLLARRAGEILARGPRETHVTARGSEGKRPKYPRK